MYGTRITPSINNKNTKQKCYCLNVYTIELNDMFTNHHYKIL